MSGRSMERESYSEFSRRIHAATGGRRIPVTATIEVTRRCNNRCVHCYTNLPAGDAVAQREEMSLDEHRRLLDELAKLGTLWLLYTGGEPFLRKDFITIYKDAKRRGFLITIFTNGTLLDDATASVLADWRPFAIEITLYGHTRETYERVSRVPGSFERCREGVRRMVERGLPLRLKSTVFRENVHELGAMKKWAEKLGVEFRFDAMINPRIDGGMQPLSSRLSPAEIVELDIGDEKRIQEWGDFCARHPVTKGVEGSGLLYSCGAAWNTLMVDPSGRIFPCGMIRQAPYDFVSGRVENAWHGHLLSLRTALATRTTRCTRCGLAAMCGMCPAYGFLENGDPEEPVDFLCHVAHLRAYALRMEIPPHGDCPYCPGGDHYDEIRRELMHLGALVVGG
ncbi:MAG: radical SAM protein [Acidobacteria bacterium]|nr:radical SAM protein [Acidobacteriota bacterium]